MSKRRVRLGSGLDPHKLAGTIRQIALADPPPPALICHLSDEEDSWIHLTVIGEQAGPEDPPTLTGWKLMLGYPTQEPPADLFSRLPIPLPAGAHIGEWEADIYATVYLPAAVSPEVLATLIASIAHELLHIDQTQTIETALEYP